MAANDPEKNIPSTAANATTRSEKEAVFEAIQRRAQSAFCFTQGTEKGTQSQWLAHNRNNNLRTRGVVFRTTVPYLIAICETIHKHILTCFNGIEQVFSLCWFPNVRVNEQAVHLRVYVLNGNLEAIEAPSLGDLHLGAEPLYQVLVDNTITSSKEGQHMFDKMLLLRL